MQQAPALIATAPGSTIIADVSVPLPGPGEIQVRATVSAASPGTDGWVVADRFTWMPTVYPCVPGYQRAGVVTAIGAGVSGWRIGERAVATIGAFAGCMRAQWGGHAALANGPAEHVWRIPDGVDDLDAAHLVVAQVGWNAAARAPIAPGERVLVMGDGMIGQCAAQAARARGARVIVAGRRARRLDIARSLGAEHAIDARSGDLAAAVRAAAGGPVAAVIDTVQGIAAQRQWIDCLEPRRGAVVYSGFTPDPAWADMGVLQQRELTAHFVSGWTRERMDATLAAIAAGALRPGALVTHRVAAAQAPELFRRIAAKDPEILGAAFEW